jgi:exopolyphosphatase/guanosine-5'-triphosphate,3'-diphosphate pyrophosphatase
MGNYAAIDCGTLSTRLLVSGPRGEPLARMVRITGLGRGVDGSGSLKPEAVQRALAVLVEYRGVMDRLDVGAVRMVGTSALRDSTNRASFCEPAARIVGTRLELLSGDEEAALSFRGATAELDPSTGPWFIADIGGGSTELVVGPEPYGACSLQLGCVRVSERFLRHDPPALSELAAAVAWLADQYAKATAGAPALEGARGLVGLAGTVSALARLDQGLVVYERDKVHHHRLSRSFVAGALQRLARLPAAGRGALPGIEQARAPFVVGGVLVLATLMDHFGFDECLVSESDILDGLTWALRAYDPAS